MKVLVVDNHATNRMILQKLLSNLGYEDITHADGTSSALEMLYSQSFDLVMIDLDLQGSSAMEFIIKTRQDDQFKPVKILITAAPHHHGAVPQAIESGADDFLFKPISGDMLAEKLAKLNG